MVKAFWQTTPSNRDQGSANALFFEVTIQGAAASALQNDLAFYLVRRKYCGGIACENC